MKVVSHRNRAEQRAEQMLGEQLERLQKLSQRNPSIRADEIESLQEKLKTTRRALTQLRCVLDSVRVIGVA
ncbi:MAG: hypothetical protein AAF404_18105 [Pseudomonadota bacterium]